MIGCPIPPRKQSLASVAGSPFYQPRPPRRRQNISARRVASASPRWPSQASSTEPDAVVGRQAEDAKTSGFDDRRRTYSLILLAMAPIALVFIALRDRVTHTANLLPRFESANPSHFPASVVVNKRSPVSASSVIA